MKKAMATLGAVLLVLGMGLSWTGARLGGSNVATVHLFGRSWSVSAPTAGSWGGARIVRSTSTEVFYEEPASAPNSALRGRVEAFSEISLDLEVADVTVAAGDDYLVEVSCWGDGYTVRRSSSGGALMVWSESDGIVNGVTRGSSVTVYVPAGEVLEFADIQVDVGSVTLAGLTACNLNVDLDVGDLTGEGLTVYNTVTVDTDVGNVDLYGDLGGAVEVDVDLGDVTLGLSRPASDYCWDLTASLGSVTVDGRHYDGISSSDAGGSGDVVLQADVDVGNIQVDFNWAQEWPVTVVDSDVVTAEGGGAKAMGGCPDRSVRTDTARSSNTSNTSNTARSSNTANTAGSAQHRVILFLSGIGKKCAGAGHRPCGK